MQTSAASPVQLFAVEAEGLRPLPVPAGAGNFHDVLDGLPLGVYSALRTFHHDRFLWLDAHLDRTDRSMELLGWDFRLDRPALRRALHAAVTAYPLADARVRFDVLAERADRPASPRARRLDTSSRVVVALSPFKPVPEAFVRAGVRVEIAPDLSRDRPLIKTADFVVRRRPYPLERQDNYEHLLLDERGGILECSSSNFHGVRGGALLTGSGGALEGITQKVLLQVAADLGVPVRRERVHVAELARLDEACLTSSTRGLVPIVDVAGTKIGDGRPGPVIERLREAYDRFAEREAAPAV
jgi:branched-subunit amino acid aminotransferase/4-amino-4-deoxychorismate lyase